MFKVLSSLAQGREGRKLGVGGRGWGLQIRHKLDTEHCQSTGEAGAHLGMTFCMSGHASLDAQRFPPQREVSRFTWKSK